MRAGFIKKDQIFRAARLLAFSLQTARSSSLRSVAPIDFFFVSSPTV